MACYVKRGDINLLNLQLAKTSTFMSGDTLAREALWETVVPAQHDSAVVAADFAVKKDILVTASEDLTVGPCVSFLR